MTWSICIFAHNEEHLLPYCLGALESVAANGEIEVHVLENGSSDNTARVARMITAVDDRITVHQLTVGDKANAWNEYVHRIAPQSAQMHIFMDGDIQPSRASFKLLDTALTSAPNAYAAVALPGSGRSRKRWAERTIKSRHINGNLYAMSAEAIKEFRTREIRFPFGAVGEDGLLTYILRTNLKGGEDDAHMERIAVACGAFFEFQSLGPNTRDMQTFHTRCRRYSERHFQKKLLYRLLKDRGIDAMPQDIREIYTPEAVRKLRPRLDPLSLYFDVSTLRRLSRHAAKLKVSSKPA